MIMNQGIYSGSQKTGLLRLIQIVFGRHRYSTISVRRMGMDTDTMRIVRLMKSHWGLIGRHKKAIIAEAQDNRV
jgi:hypothetical protein